MSSYESIDVPKFCMVFPLKSKGMTSRWPLIHIGVIFKSECGSSAGFKYLLIWETVW